MLPIPDDLIQAYGDTDYVVLSSVPFTLKVGQKSVDLRDLCQRYQAGSAAFLTAWNPYSRLLSSEENARRNVDLAREIQQKSLTSLPAVGRDPSGHWPGEDSFLVLGIARETAAALAIQFEQNGYLWCGADAVPELVLLR